MRMKIVAALLLSVSCNAWACDPVASGQTAKVSTAAEAILAARGAWQAVYDKASWHAVYSPSSIKRAEPFTAQLRGSTWYVWSTLNDSDATLPEATVCQSTGAAQVGARVR
jgi:hypothetical protein